jgi:hypothetical protein
MQDTKTMTTTTTIPKTILRMIPMPVRLPMSQSRQRPLWRLLLLPFLLRHHLHRLPVNVGNDDDLCGAMSRRKNHQQWLIEQQLWRIQLRAQARQNRLTPPIQVRFVVHTERNH